MNRIFRIIWSRALHVWVVASEWATGQGKEGGSVDRRVSRDGLAFKGDFGVRPANPPSPLRPVVLATLMALPAMTSAADRYWDVNGTGIGSGGSGTWDTSSAVWSINNDGVSGPYSAWNNATLDDAFFGTTPGTITLAGPISVHNLNFVSMNGWVLNGNSLALGGVNPTITNAGTVTINSAINSASGLIKAGAGALTLNGSNTFGGGIDINGGSLTLNAANSFTGAINAIGGSLFIGTVGDAALGSLGNVINLGSGRTLSSSGTISASRTVNLVSGTGSIQGSGLGGLFYTGAGGLSVADGIALTNNANNYTGQTFFTTQTGWSGSSNSFSSVADLGVASALGAPTTVANGTIVIGPGGGQSLGPNQVYYTGSGNSSNRNWQINPGAYAGSAWLYNAGSGALTLTGNISTGGAGGHTVGLVAQNADMNLLGVISGYQPMTFSANAGRTVRLGIANTFTGGASIGGAGNVEAALIANVGVAGSLGTGGISISGGNLSYIGAGEATNKTWSINNGSLNSNGTGALSLSGTVGISNTATLGGSYTAADNVISGVISGSGNLRSAGPATWVLNGANTYTGSTIVDGGTLRAGTANAFGNGTTFQVNGGTLDLNSFSKTVATLTGTGGTVNLGSATLTLQAAAGTTASYAGNITGSGGLTKLGASTQTLTGANTYTGATTVGGGVLALDFSTAGGPTSNIVSGNSTLTMAGGRLNVVGAAGEANTQTFNGLNVTGSNNTIDAKSGTGGSLTVNLGAITRTGGLINFNLPTSGNITTTNSALGGWATVNGTDYAKVMGGNILAFTAADYTNKDNAANWLDNEYITDSTGFFGTVSGTKQLAGLRYTVAKATTVTVNAGQTLGVDGTIIVAPTVAGFNQTINGGMMTGANGGDLGIQQNSTGNFTINSQIVDNGGSIGFVKAGTGLVTLSNAGNSYTGATRVAQGTLAVSNIGNGGAASGIGASSAASSNLMLEGATLSYTGTGNTSDRGFTFTKSGAILGSGVDVTNAAANLTFSGLVTSPDGASFAKGGAGTLTLSNSANDFTGIVMVNGGLLSVNTLANGGVVSGIGAGGSASSNLVLNGGGLQYTGATTTTNRGFTLGANGGGGGIVDVAAAGTTLTVSGVVAGSNAAGNAGQLTKNGSGTLVLSGANTYSGGNTVNGGILRAGAANVFGAFTGSPTVLANTAGVGLDLNNFNNMIGPLNGGGANGGNVTLGSATLRIVSGNGIFSGVISGTGGIWRTDGGNQTFNGCNNTYTGVTNLQGATLTTDCLANGGQASGIGASTSASTNLVFNSGNLNYTGASVSIDRGFQLNSGYGVINVTNAASTLGFSGAVVGGAEIYKDGPGAMVLSGNNTYTNNTHVRGGVLRAGSATAFGTTNSFWLDNTAGVMLDMNGFDANAGALIGGGTVGGNISMGSGNLTIRDGLNQTYAGAISGSGNLVKNGGGIQTLRGCGSSYTGSTTINGGTLQVDCLKNGGVNSALGASSSNPANLVISGGTLAYIGAGDATDRQLTLGAGVSGIDSSGTGAIGFTSTAPVTLAGAGNRTLTLTGTNTGDNLFSGLLSDPAGAKTALIKTGTGTWRLSNSASTYTGVTTISGGILAVDKMSNGGVASSIGASSNAAANLVVGNGATLRYTGSGDLTDRQFTLDTGVTYIQSSGTGALLFTNTGPVTLLGANMARTIALGGTNKGNNTMGGTIGDNGTGKTTLAKNDSGTWVLTGNNTYSGNTVINNGNLMVGNGGTTGNAGVGNVIVDSATSTLSLNRSDTFTFAGTLSGPGTLAQVGPGTSVLTSPSNQIGATTISAGTLQVDGGLTTPTIAMTGGSRLTVNGTLGGSGAPALLSSDGSNATIIVNAGGTLNANGDLGSGTNAVTLAGTLNTGAGTLDLGGGNDTLTLNDGASIVGAVAGGAGTDTLQVNNASAMTLQGGSPAGFEILNKTAGGTLTLAGNHSYSAGTTIGAGTLQIGNGATAGALATPTVANNGVLAFNLNSDYTFAGAISGSGSVDKLGSGTTTLTGTNSYAGPTTVQAGTLLINGNQAGATGPTLVASGAALGGTGTIGGSVTVVNGATLAPGDAGSVPGTLAIRQDLTLNSGSVLNYNFGQANVVGGPLNDLVTVGGNLTLAGTLNVSTSPGGSFGPGLYRVMSYGGTLINNGLTIGTMPSPGSYLQTSIANQVNLVNSNGLALNFWDGDAGPKNNGIVNGGNGIWQSTAGSDNWTTPDGAINAPYSNGAFAVFAGAPGNVIVDNSLGQVSASGMQFATGGYRLTGGSIALAGVPTSTIRVGDGTQAGSGFVATVDNVLSGNTQLVKTDLGTLVLNGANTYTGGTAINGGTLRISDDANLGAASGALSFDGGTLQNTGAISSARAVTLNAGGGTLQTDASLALSGAIDGAGGLTKTGAATLTLTGNNSYAGGTTISGGTLQLGNGGTSGAIVGDIVNNGALAVNRSDTLTLGGTISGSGTVNQIGSGTTVLSGNNSYTGGTTISAGTLQLGAGGAAGAIVGNVNNNGALAFDRSDTYGFAGLISGTGAVNQIGSGTTILTGNNSYAGATTISTGALIVNGDQTAATGLVSVGAGGTLGGTGIVGGSVNVTAGNINPGNPGTVPGTLTIQQDLTLASNSALNYNFGQANVVGGPLNDLTVVKGNLTLDGTINVSVTGSGSFDPGIYRVISYSGALTDNGLQTGVIPSPNYFVQSSIANQINLVNTGGLTLNFWDGAAGPKFNGAVNGGNGVWQNSAGNDNWTTLAGDINAPFTNGSFAIFSATPGTVTVDNGLGQVSASGMQFASNGYHLVGGEIALAGTPTSTIRVGDGTQAGSGFVATVDNVLSGNTQLVKTDLGTLVLNGANTYTGGTAINGGTLRISDDANLGAASGALSFDGGTLQNTGAISSARAVTLNAGGGTLQTDASLALSGAIDGAGGLTKTGAATLTLTGNNSYAGGTTISGGTLQLGNGGTSGAIVGDIVNNGALAVNRSDTLTLGGTISGSGTVNQIGSGTTVLSGNNSYTGGTTISAGTLIVDGNQAAAIGQTSVNTGGVLGGSGTLGGNVVVANGGAIHPGAVGSVGTLTVNGDLALSAGSSLNYDFGQANVVGGAFNDLINVHGNLKLGGTLNVNVSPGGTFGPGLYRVINYDGALTDNGLALGTIPSSNAYVATSIAHQVNLVNAEGLTLNVWDGAAGPKNDNVVNGGDGTWQSSAGNNNWTTGTGDINAPFTNGAFAIFSATPGVVKVDNSLGQVTVSGMQFASSGYRIGGGEIELGGPSSIIRVGDGTAAGAGYVATIDSVLSGSAQLVKTDLGTLALTGANTYSGGTTISGGTLQIGDGGTTGSITGDVTNNATLAFNRADRVSFAGAISGSGAVNQIGSGTTVLAGTNTYSGATNVSAGTLAAGGTNTLSANSAVTLASGATLDLQGFSQSVAGLSNAGVINMGSGASPGTVLTVTGNYVGNGGAMLFNTALGDSASATDRMVVNGSTSGTTNVRVNGAAASLGAQTSGDGILLVQVGGASNGSFIQAGRIAAGAYDYTLVKNGVGSDAANGNWYLRSTRTVPDRGSGGADPRVGELPAYRAEVPLDVSVSTLAGRFGLAMLGNSQGRLDSLSCPEPSQAERTAGRTRNTADCMPPSALWGRIFGEDGNFRNGGGQTATERLANFRARGPSYDYRASGFQTGADLFRSSSDLAGVYIGTGQVNSTVQNIYGGPAAGSVRMDGYSLGGYWTHRDTSGWYTDSMLQGTWYGRIRTTSKDPLQPQALKASGTGLLASVEGGYPIALGKGLVVEPQAQLLYQWTGISNTADGFGQIHFGNTSAIIGRLGGRVTQDWNMDSARPLKTWARLNVWHTFGGSSNTTFTNLSGLNPTTVSTGRGNTWLQFGLGVSGDVARNVSVFATGDYNITIGRGSGHSFGGQIGVRYVW